MADYKPTYSEQPCYDPQTLAALVDQRTVRVETVEGRTVVFGHRNLIDLTKRPLARTHRFESFASFCAFVKAKGDPATSLIFLKDGLIEIVLDGVWMENVSSYPLTPSKARQRWLLRAYDQEEIIDLLEAWQGEIEYFGTPSTGDVTSLLAKFKQLNLAQDISYDSKYDDANNIKLNFSIAEKGDVAAVPKLWGLKIPLFEGAPAQVLDCRLKYTVPKVKGEAPVFKFECPKLESYVEQALLQIEADLKQELSDFLILRGSKS